MQSVEAAIDSFREAAIVPDQWSTALDRLSQSLFSDGAALVLREVQEHSIAWSGSIAPFIGEYLKLPFSDPREQRARVSERDGFLPDLAHFTSKEIAADPYYQEFLIPRGYGCNAIAALHGDLMISVKRGVRRGHYDGADLATLNAALPWLRAASRAASMAWRCHFSGQLSAFEQLGIGAILIDVRARVLQTNACVHFGDGLDVCAGVLQVPRAVDRPRLQRFISAMLQAGDTRSLPGSTTLGLFRPSGRYPWVLDGIGCSQALRCVHSNAAALVLVTDLAQQRRPRQAALVELFGLAPKEVELACQLTAGLSLQAAALQLHISEEHARQRLKALFHKTSTSRQGELIALLSRLT